FQSSTNIIGGVNLGGNYYVNKSGGGFSQTCTDGGGDGICDSSFTLSANNIDYLPLTKDFTAPNSANNGTNETATWPKINDSIHMNITMTDGIGLSWYIFSWNHSGAWENSTNGSISGTSYLLMVNKTVNATNRAKIGWMVFFNDTSGNKNQSEIFWFTMKSTPPQIPSPNYPENRNFSFNRTPMFNWTYHDPDSDVLRYEMNFTKFGGLGGECTTQQYSNITNITNNYFVLNETYELQCLRDENYYYNWSVRAFDGDFYSGWSDFYNVSVVGLMGIIVVNDTIQFGTMTGGDINDTTDKKPYPFVLENSGNVYVNITINATQLWALINYNSSYYQYRVANASTRNDSFNFSLSNTSFQFMPLLSGSMSLRDFQYNDYHDWAEVDLKIEVPISEIDGNKETIVNFLAERTR
ncbi:MAG: hypothetical protein AABX51_04275, partial [Nanoarchaeota archaeon]